MFSHLDLCLSLSPTAQGCVSDCTCLSLIKSKFLTPFPPPLAAPVSWKMSKEQTVCVGDEYFPERGPTLTFSDLHYCVREARVCRGGGPEKHILNNVRYDNWLPYQRVHVSISRLPVWRNTPGVDSQLPFPVLYKGPRRYGCCISDSELWDVVLLCLWLISSNLCISVNIYRELTLFICIFK